MLDEIVITASDVLGVFIGVFIGVVLGLFILRWLRDPYRRYLRRTRHLSKGSIAKS